MISDANRLRFNPDGRSTCSRCYKSLIELVVASWLHDFKVEQFRCHHMISIEELTCCICERLKNLIGSLLNRPTSSVHLVLWIALTSYDELQDFKCCGSFQRFIGWLCRTTIANSAWISSKSSLSNRRPRIFSQTLFIVSHHVLQKNVNANPIDFVYFCMVFVSEI